MFHTHAPYLSVASRECVIEHMKLFILIEYLQSEKFVSQISNENNNLGQGKEVQRQYISKVLSVFKSWIHY